MLIKHPDKFRKVLDNLTVNIKKVVSLKMTI